MAKIDDPTLLGLVQDMRVLCSAHHKNFERMESLLALYDSAAIGGDASYPDEDDVDDGAENDGRVSLHGSNVRENIQLYREVVADLRADSNTKLNKLLMMAAKTGSISQS